MIPILLLKTTVVWPSNRLEIKLNLIDNDDPRKCSRKSGHTIYITSKSRFCQSFFSYILIHRPIKRPSLTGLIRYQINSTHYLRI